MGSMSNHFYMEGEFSEFYDNKSVILNSDRTENILQRENFLLATALGYYIGFKTPFKEGSKKDRKDKFVMNQLTDDELALIYAIAISDTKDISIVNDDVKVAEIAMGYANTGIRELKTIEEGSQKGNEIKKFQVYLQDVADEIKKNNNFM